MMTESSENTAAISLLKFKFRKLLFKENFEISFSKCITKIESFYNKKITESGITALKEDLNNLKSNFSRLQRLRNYDSTNLMRHHPAYFEQFVISPEYFVQPCQTSPLKIKKIIITKKKTIKIIRRIVRKEANQAATQKAEDSEDLHLCFTKSCSNSIT